MFQTFQTTNQGYYSTSKVAWKESCIFHPWGIGGVLFRRSDHTIPLEQQNETSELLSQLWLMVQEEGLDIDNVNWRNDPPLDFFWGPIFKQSHYICIYVCILCIYLKVLLYSVYVMYSLCISIIIYIVYYLCTLCMYVCMYIYIHIY